MVQNPTNKKFIIIGLSAGLLLLILYFGILSLAESFSHAIQQFSQMWYLILLLVAGFGLQIGLYFYIRESFRLRQMASPTTAVAASGGVSTGSMIACCLHHVTDVLPLMGLAAAAVFLTKYQLWFIILGIFSNLIGIVIMLEIIQKHNLAGGFLNKVLIYNMSRIKRIAIASSLALLLISFLWISNTRTPVTASLGSDLAAQLSGRTDSQGSVSFEVTPSDFNINDPLKFEIKVDTHSGSLDFDLARVSFLTDDIGNEYKPLRWDGPSPGGHHIAGILSFPQLKVGAEKIKLTIQDAYLRIFEWDLK